MIIGGAYDHWGGAYDNQGGGGGVPMTLRNAYDCWGSL